MSRVLSAHDIASEALGAIGAFPTTENAPQTEHLRRAMTWLDVLLAERAGTERVFGRSTPALLTLTIVNGTQNYNLVTALGTQIPADGIQYILNAWLQDDLGTRLPIEIVTRQRFESIEKPAQTGVPVWLYIDRQELPNAFPTLRIFPTPDTTDPRTYTIYFEAQRFAPNVAPGGVTGTQPQNAVMHAFGQTWQRWMMFQLAHDLGAGPIFKISDQSLTRFQNAATAAWTRLMAFENREHENSPPVCESGWDYDCDHDRRTRTDYGNRRVTW